MNSKNKNVLILVLSLVILALIGVIALRPKVSNAPQPTIDTTTAQPSQSNSQPAAPAATPTTAATTKTRSTATTTTHVTSSNIAAPTVMTLEVGTIFPGGCGLNPCQNPTPSSVVINGSFSGNGGSTTTWFEYWDQTAGGAIKTTQKVKQNNTKGGVTETLVGLTQGHTYGYRIIAQNSAGITRGGAKTFYIPVQQ